MPSLTIRNIPEDVLERLRHAAAEERRSVNAQTVQWLERASRQWVSRKKNDALIERIDSLRERIRQTHGPGGDSARTLREMRQQRGRR